MRMPMQVRTLARVLLVAAWVATPAWAADDEALRKDLTAVIALQGQPCGKVVSVKSQSDNDHIATCQDGNRYRVFVNPEGRVVVQKQ